MRWAGHVASRRERTRPYSIFVGRPKGKRPLGRPRRRWEDNIKMDIQEVGWGGMDWIDLAEMVGPCGCGIEPSSSIK
jgi:hypothetical protein